MAAHKFEASTEEILKGDFFQKRIKVIIEYALRYLNAFLEISGEPEKIDEAFKVLMDYFEGYSAKIFLNSFFIENGTKSDNPRKHVFTLRCVFFCDEYNRKNKVWDEERKGWYPLNCN